MLNIEDLPTEIQLMIWRYAHKIAYTERNLADDADDEKAYRCAKKAGDYCLYMRDVNEYDLGLTKYKPWPHYLPTCRKCKTCKHLSIPKSDPAWKTQCIECYKHSKYPWIYGFR